MTSRRCGACGHAFHRDGCRGKAPAGYQPLLDPASGEQIGHACSRGPRPPCPCPRGACHTCGAVIVGASTLPLDDGSPEIDLDPEPAGGGTWAVRTLADSTLAIRRLGAGQQPGPREWRAREHRHQLAEVTLWDPAGHTRLFVQAQQGARP